jgi:hypothetical protein
MVIYLLANDPKVVEKIESLNLNPEDLLVAFNTCAPLVSPKFKRHKNKIIMCRQHSDTSSNFLGKKNIKKYADLFKEVRIFRSRVFTEQQITDYKKLKESYPNVTWCNERKCKYLVNHRHRNKKLAAQAGFVGYCMMKQQFPNETIKLVGFTRFPEKNEGHSYLHEKQFYKYHNVEII